jgi:hypothetical protein
MESRSLRRTAGWLGGLALVLGLGTGSARALPLAGDQTIVLLTSAGLLDSVGISVAGSGTAVVALDVAGRPEALFPITGGDLTGLAGTIEHEGSGLVLSQGATDLPLGNFLIDTTQLLLFGDTPLGNVPLFDIGLCTNLAGTAAECVDGDGSVLLDGFKLSITSTAAGALSQVFGLPDLTGAQIGVARIDARVVPEPGTAMLLGLGLAGAALRGRGARRA